MKVRRLDEELSGDVSNGAADHNVRLAKNSYVWLPGLRYLKHCRSFVFGRLHDLSE